MYEKKDKNNNTANEPFIYIYKLNSSSSNIDISINTEMYEYFKQIITMHHISFLIIFFFCYITNDILKIVPIVQAYQYIPPDSPIIRGTFSPYAQGFTGYYGEPSDPRRYPVNPGNPLSPDKPLRFTGVNGRQNCPGMIGPLDGMVRLILFITNYSYIIYISTT